MNIRAGYSQGAINQFHCRTSTLRFATIMHYDEPAFRGHHHHYQSTTDKFPTSSPAGQELDSLEFVYSTILQPTSLLNHIGLSGYQLSNTGIFISFIVLFPLLFIYLSLLSRRSIYQALSFAFYFIESSKQLYDIMCEWGG
jgi:hypothetical protein